jgi:hypothetical protein
VFRATTEMTGGEAVALALRAYGFSSADRQPLQVEFALDIDEHRELLIAAIDRLIDDQNMLDGFVARTGFTLEQTYTARRKLTQLAANLTPSAVPRSLGPGRGAERNLRVGYEPRLPLRAW